MPDRMKKFFLILHSAFLIHNFSYAQPAIQWQKCFGGTGADQGYAIQQSADGGYIVAGSTNSNNGDVTGNHDTTGNSTDYWLVKLDSSGNLQWQKCFGGTDNDKATSLRQTTDGGYVVAGYTLSNDGDVTGYHGFFDYWIVKLDNSGNILWQKCLGGTVTDFAYSIQQTTDGGYIVAGNTQSNDGDVTGNHDTTGFKPDYWIVKLNGSGNLQWQKCLGGTNNEYGNSVQQTVDGGYVVAGYTNSTDGDVTGNHGYSDNWLVKLDGSGNLQWQKCLGGTASDFAYSIQQTTDGGYVVAGYTYSNDGDVTSNHGNWDYWVIKSDSNGNLQWQKCLGGTNDDLAHSVQETADGGFIITGYTQSNDGDVTGAHGTYDCWLVKLNSSGNLQWQKSLGGTAWDEAHTVKQVADGGYIVAGYTQSNDGDVTGNHGFYDYWIVKLSPYVGIEEEINNDAYTISPNPFTTNAIISFSSQVYNATFSVYNLLGEKVTEVTGINGESFEFNRGNLQNGVYVFEVRDKDKSIARGKAVVY
jgi:hypothetical protein